MKRAVPVLAFLWVMCLFSVGQALEAGRPLGVFSQLSTEKQTAFLEARKAVWEATAATREQIRAVEAEIKTVMTASEFNRALYLEKTKALHDLRAEIEAAIDEAVAALAAQFTAEERTLLAELISRRFGPPGPGPGR